jgi:hypothetical protein
VRFADRLRAWLRGDDRPGGDARSTSHGGTGADPSPSGRGSASGSGLAASARRARGRRGRGQHPAGTFDGSALLEFARSRVGVEVYVEPRTNLYGDSVLLVADDGEYLRRPVPDAQTVRRFCSEHGIPVYDVARTGYPRRVRDYDRGMRPRRIELADLPPWPGAEPAATAEPDGRAAPSSPPDASDASEPDDGDDEPPPPPASAAP